VESEGYIKEKGMLSKVTLCLLLIAKYVDKLLDVEPGELCYFVGTVYMEMPLKPNVLDEVSLEVHL
jgi:hypothetical protein